MINIHHHTFQTTNASSGQQSITFARDSSSYISTSHLYHSLSLNMLACMYNIRLSPTFIVFLTHSNFFKNQNNQLIPNEKSTPSLPSTPFDQLLLQKRVIQIRDISQAPGNPLYPHFS